MNTQNEEARAVVQDVETYEATRKALLLLKMLSRGESQIRRGRGIKQTTIFSRLEKRISHA